MNSGHKPWADAMQGLSSLGCFTNASYRNVPQIEDRSHIFESLPMEKVIRWCCSSSVFSFGFGTLESRSIETCEWKIWRMSEDLAHPCLGNSQILWKCLELCTMIHIIPGLLVEHEPGFCCTWSSVWVADLLATYRNDEAMQDAPGKCSTWGGELSTEAKSLGAKMSKDQRCSDWKTVAVLSTEVEPGEWVINPLAFQR